MATGSIVVYYPKVTLDIIYCLRYGIVYVHDVKESGSVLRKRLIRSDGPTDQVLYYFYLMTEVVPASETLRATSMPHVTFTL